MGASSDCALVVAPCAFCGRRKPRVLAQQSRLFVTGARDRSEMQFSWQVQHFGHGGDRRGAQIS